MKKLLLTTFLVSSFGFTAVKAETLPAPVIGVVEQQTLYKSDAWKAVIKQVEQKRNEVQKEMSGYETELKTEEKKLADEQKKMSEKDFATKKQAFEKRVHEAQEKFEIRKIQMELAGEAANKKVLEAFLKVADSVKNEVGANIVIYKETVVTADNVFDLTPLVLEGLNKALPTIQVVYKSDADVKKELMKQIQIQPQ